MDKIFCYKRRVYYYETDKMNRVYHSNFFSWMEETRTEFLRSVDLNYKKMEEQGVFLPISETSIKFYKPVEYDDEVIIELFLKKKTGVRIEFHYRFYREDELLAEADTVNVFTDINGKIQKASKELLCKIEGGI